jgi:Copper transport outer membrane protein, MctB
VAQTAGITLGTGEPYQQQAAQVLATEILAKSGATATGGQASTQQSDAQTMLAAYAQSGFLITTGQPAAQATLVVIVTPQNAPSDGSDDSLDLLLVPVAQELAAKSSATVVAGSSAGSGAGSPIAVLRSNNVASLVSTIDDADFVAGQSVVMEALATELNGGKAGSFGFTANGATAVAPSPVPTTCASPSGTPSTPAKPKGKK